MSLHTMIYADGNSAVVGDIVSIDVRYRGRVVACMYNNTFLPGFEHWAYLEDGMMIDTDFGGMVYYSDSSTDDLRLLKRCNDVSLR